MDELEDESGSLPSSSDRHLQTAIRPDVQREVLSALKGEHARLDRAMKETVDAIQAQLERKTLDKLIPLDPTMYPGLWSLDLGDEQSISRLAEGMMAGAEVAESVIRGLGRRNPEFTSYQSMEKEARKEDVAQALSATGESFRTAAMWTLVVDTISGTVTTR